MPVKHLKDMDLAQKRVLMRVDYNTPMKDGRVADDSRIRAGLPTLQYLLERKCQLVLMSHLGRPKDAFDPEFSLAPVAAHLAELLGRNVTLLSRIEDYNPNEPLQMLENIRFFPGEKKNDPGFAKQLAVLGDVYINDAFGAAHRAHASISAVCSQFDQKGAGLLLEKELLYLDTSLKEPARPFSVILGGAKVSDKLAIIKNLLPKVDKMMIGGAMSYTFLKAKGVSVGTSRVEEDFLAQACEILAHCQDNNIELLLPLDHVTANAFAQDAEGTITHDENIPDGMMGLDIGPETIDIYTRAARESKTIVWNGPMGVFEWEAFSTGTISVAEAVADADAMTIIGGGDSVAAINRAGVSGRITHISTGGGASLELLGGTKLPGVAALEA